MVPKIRQQDVTSEFPLHPGAYANASNTMTRGPRPLLRGLGCNSLQKFLDFGSAWARVKHEHPRIFQHTPGTYPLPTTSLCMIRNFFHLGVWGCLGYAKQGYVGALFESSIQNIFTTFVTGRLASEYGYWIRKLCYSQ